MLYREMKVDSVVYFLLDPTSKAIKIGNSNLMGLSKRLGTLQTASSSTLSLLGVVWGSMDQERSLHEHFKEYHIRGEWFHCTDEILSYIRENWDFTIQEYLDEQTKKFMNQ